MFQNMQCMWEQLTVGLRLLQRCKQGCLVLILLLDLPLPFRGGFLSFHLSQIHCGHLQPASAGLRNSLKNLSQIGEGRLIAKPSQVVSDVQFLYLSNLSILLLCRK